MLSIKSKRRWIVALTAATLSCKSDSLDPVGGAVASVVIAPTTATVAVGASAPLRAEALDAGGKALAGRRMVWASSNRAIATVSNDGVVTGVAIGTVQIAASTEGKSAVAAVTVNPTPVASVRLTPTSRDLLVGQTVPLSAQALDASGNVLDGRPVTFTTSNATVASVSASGVVTALAPGSAIITAASEGRSSVATITVTTVPVASVTVTPNASPVVVGQSTQLRADAKDASGQTLAGRPIVWSTSAAGVATVSSTGLVIALAPGSATITATSEGKTGTATITVSPKPVSAVIISPGQASVTVGQTAQLSGQVTDDAGNLLSGRPITYSSGSPGIATVSASGLVTGVAAGTATITATSEGKTGTATIVVTPVPVARVGVSPSEASVIVGQTVQLDAAAEAANGQTLTGRTVVWSSGDPSVASVSAAGLVTGLAPGSTVVFASVDGVTGTAVITVRQIPVGTVTISPPTSSVVVGGSTQLTATVRDGSGATLTNRLVGWTSSDESIAIVSSTGRVNALKAGTVTITASSEGKSGTATVTVTPSPVATVNVTPPTANLTIGQTTALAAELRDASNNVLTGRAIAWSTSNAAVATVSPTGVVTAAGTGTATITATSEGKTGTATITVAAVPVATVTVAPTTLPLQAGQTGTLTATARDAANNVLAGRAITWSSSNTNVATVAPNGTVTAVAPGSATISATSEGKTGTAAVTVTAVPVASVTVAPSTLPLQVGQSGTLTASTLDASNNALAGRAVAWSSSNTSVATVSQAGVVTAVGPGTATITATSEGRSGTASVTVSVVPVASVTVAPPTLSVADGQTGTLTATVRDAANNVLTGRTVTWTSSATGVATVAPNGTVTGVAPGTATITATSEGKTGTSTVTVTAVPVATVTVAPTSLPLQTGQTGTLTATTRDASNAVLTGRVVAWSSSNTNVATVSPAGVVTAVGPGTATITATSEGRNGTASVTVTAVPVASVAVSPTTASLTTGGTQQITATPRDAAGNALTGRAVTWQTSNANVATVTQAGLITAVGVGSANVTATSEGRVGTVSVTVTSPPVASVAVTPTSASVNVAATTTLSAVVRDANGAVVAGAPITWSSDKPQTAAVSQTGVVTGLLPGTATITATSGGRSGTATITVSIAPVATVTVTPSSLNLRDKDNQRTGQLTATTRDALGNVVTGRTVTWSSSNPNVATVNQSGTVTAQGRGDATITATSEGKTGTASITVQN
ncbi:MAG TPA: Ig-like domain-containing protein [Gemmatimonadaceae bacterium]|nr:Ig-like domain-containing protein [Gemmatimonadaceae bacterium]